MTQGSPQHDRGPFVMAMIAIAALLFLSTAAVMYYRWTTMHEPMCVLVIEAAPSLRGAEVTVDSVILPKAYHAVIGENNRYSIPFFLDEGTYVVKVTLKDQLQFEIPSLELTRQLRGRRIDLTRIRPTTLPVTGPLGSEVSEHAGR